MNWCLKCWKDHSLTIALSVIAIVFFGLAFLKTPPDGINWDFFLGLGHGTATAALMFVLSGYTREKNKPDD